MYLDNTCVIFISYLLVKLFYFNVFLRIFSLLKKLAVEKYSFFFFYEQIKFLYFKICNFILKT